MGNPILDIQHIKKRYIMGSQIIDALKDVSISINKNEYVALMGPSGSGKSTMMNILGCLDTPTSGSYKLNGTEVSEMTDDQLAYVRNKEIGFVFQTFNLLPRLTSLENVALPMIYAGMSKKERTERAEQVTLLRQLQVVDGREVVEIARIREGTCAAAGGVEDEGAGTDADGTDRAGRRTLRHETDFTAASGTGAESDARGERRAELRTVVAGAARNDTAAARCVAREVACASEYRLTTGIVGEHRHVAAVVVEARTDGQVSGITRTVTAIGERVGAAHLDAFDFAHAEERVAALDPGVALQREPRARQRRTRAMAYEQGRARHDDDLHWRASFPSLRLSNIRSDKTVALAAVFLY